MPDSANVWIIEAVGETGRRSFYGPFVDEDEAENWGMLNLDFDLEDDGPTWDHHEMSLVPPEQNGGDGYDEVRRRLADDNGNRTTLADVANELGIDLDTLDESAGNGSRDGDLASRVAELADREEFDPSDWNSTFGDDAGPSPRSEQ